MTKLLIIIPARIGSKRLKEKNILPIKNLPMLVYVAKEAMKSKYKPHVYISTESKKIINICNVYGLNYVIRPKKLANDHVEKQEAIIHAYKKLKKKIKPNIIVSLQPNTPEFKINDLDKAIKFFKKIFLSKSIKEVISLNENQVMNGAFRIMMPNGVCKKTLSTNIGVVFTNYIDVHNHKDYLKAKKRIEND